MTKPKDSPAHVTVRFNCRPFSWTNSHQDKGSSLRQLFFRPATLAIWQPGTFVHDSTQAGHSKNCWWRKHASCTQFGITVLSPFVFQIIAHGYVSFGVFFIKSVDHQTLSRDKAVSDQPKQDQRKRKTTLPDNETAKTMNCVILTVFLAELPNKAWL